MFAAPEDIAYAALVKLGMRPTVRIGTDQVKASTDFVAIWDQVLARVGLVEQIRDAIVAEMGQILFFENEATKRRLTWQQRLDYISFGVGYILGLRLDGATDPDVADIRSLYTNASNSLLKIDQEKRLKRLESAVCLAIEGNTRFARDEGDSDVPDGTQVKVEPHIVVRSVQAPHAQVHLEPVALPKPSWNFLPLPGGLDPHTEFAAESAPGVGGFKLIGARARGKKHKHEGTNCDDWFEFGSVGAWNLIAVSDGAGSKKYSRVGAKSACEEAIQLLRKELATVKITVPPETALDGFFAQEPDRTFKTDSIEKVQSHLHNAMQSAFHAVESAYTERVSGERAALYKKSLDDRDLELADLSCTLLLAVQTEFSFKGQEYSFILACQVGDGMTAAIYDTAGGMAAAVLGSADSGEFSGETEFLTSKGKVDLPNLRLKTQSLICRLNTLMVMTDGVADDYFPNSIEAPRLFADLMLNGVLESSKNANLSPEDQDLVAQAKSGPGYVDLVQTVEAVPKEVPIASAQKLSDALGISASVLMDKPGVLAELASPISGASAEDRLRQWIDTYQVRGSFDDRTLVVLHKDGHK